MRTARAMLAALARGEVTAIGLAVAALDRIAAQDGLLRAFIAVDAEGARRAARDSDRRRASGVAGLLEGVPVAVKDNLDVTGLPTTDGTGFSCDAALADAAAVARLRAEGAVILGKLNMHEGALGATTDNPFWGRCRNPLDEDLTPGGSSGGSAAAVAAGYAPIALGTDTMGSVRIPAAYCGLWGLKPGAGAIPRGGLTLLSDTLDTIGPLAGDADDLALAWQALGGAAPARSEGPLTLGIPREALDVGLEPAVAGAFSALTGRLAAAGIAVQEVSVPGWAPSRLRRAGLLVAEAEAGTRLGPELDSGRPGFSDDFRALLAYGRAAPPARIAAARVTLAQAAAAARQALSGVTALLLPTAPQRAFRHGTPAPASQADLTALANAAGLPAVAFPVPSPDGGLPASAQLLGPAGSEARLIALARRLHDLAR